MSLPYGIQSILVEVHFLIKNAYFMAAINSQVSRIIISLTNKVMCSINALKIKVLLIGDVNEEDPEPKPRI